MVKENQSPSSLHLKKRYLKRIFSLEFSRGKDRRYCLRSTREPTKFGCVSGITFSLSYNLNLLICRLMQPNRRENWTHEPYGGYVPRAYDSGLTSTNLEKFTNYVHHDSRMGPPPTSIDLKAGVGSDTSSVTGPDTMMDRLHLDDDLGEHFTDVAGRGSLDIPPPDILEHEGNAVESNQYLQ